VTVNKVVGPNTAELTPPDRDGLGSETEVCRLPLDEYVLSHFSNRAARSELSIFFVLFLFSHISLDIKYFKKGKTESVRLVQYLFFNTTNDE